MSKKYFLGWENIRWFIIELGKLGSNNDGYFSKKRIESGIAFMVVIWGCIFWLVKKHSIMTTEDFLIWSAVPASVAGYYVYHTQKEKIKDKDENK